MRVTTPAHKRRESAAVTRDGLDRPAAGIVTNALPAASIAMHSNGSKSFRISLYLPLRENKNGHVREVVTMKGGQRRTK